GSYYSGVGATIAPFGAILPYIEQDALYQQIKTSGYPSTMPKIFVDPSDATQAKHSYTDHASYRPGLYYSANIVYVANPYYYSGSSSYGIFSDYNYSYTYSGGPSNGYSYSYAGKKKPMSQIFSDGLSNTLMVTENVSACSSYYGNSWYYDYGLQNVYY